MKTSTIQTLHPEKGKKNKSISLDKYELVKNTIIKILKRTEPTHTELVQELKKSLTSSFTGNISWYGTVVKLDLEARKLVVRTKSTPQRYQLRS